MKIQRSRLLAGVSITALLHLAILAIFTQRQHAAETLRTRGDAIQWLLPLANTAPPVLSSAIPPALPARAHATVPGGALRHRAEARPSRTAGVLGVLQPPQSSQPAQAQSHEAAAAAVPPAQVDDPFALPPAPPAARDIVQQARLDVGKIDRQLRKDYPERFPLPPPDSKQATLERGFNAAHEAVPPKWYEGAKIVELGTPDGENKTRTYKIITAAFSYCVNVRPDGRRSYTSCPK